MAWNPFGGRGASVVPAPDRDRALALFEYPSCPYCQRVLRRLGPLGLTDAVTLRDVHREDGAMAELVAATGGTQVPCLVVDGVPLLESADIVDWLEAYAARAPRRS